MPHQSRTCPSCAESIPAARAATCPSCGEPLDAAKGSSVALKIALIVVGAIVLLGVCGVGVMATVLTPALMKAKEKANRTRCANNLRQLGLAAIQYADDKRLYPHVGATSELDGDVTTNHGPKKIRTLLWSGYHDAPESWICPSSADAAATVGSVNNPRGWFWGGRTNPAAGSASPLVDGAPDPTLSATTELSYGWTRRALNSNVRSRTILAADRAVRDGTDTSALAGNHSDAWNVLSVDGTVQWQPVATQPSPGSLTSTDRSDPSAGFLGIKEQ